MRDTLHFWSRAFKAPKHTGAVHPSSRFLAAMMVSGVDWPGVTTAVELGPGTGVFTEVIRDRLPPQARFLAVELDPGFAERLRERFPDLDVIEGSAEDLTEHLEAVEAGPADCILCGLPWSNFDKQLQIRLLEGICGALKPGGTFATFAYLHGPIVPSGRRFLRLLRETFAAVEISPLVWRNLPPARVYRCRK